MHLIKQAARVRRKTSSPGMMTSIMYLGQNRTSIRWMLSSPMKVQHRPPPMMLLMLAQLTKLSHLIPMLTWEIQATYPLMQMSQTPLLMQECLKIQVQRAVPMKKPS